MLLTDGLQLIRMLLSVCLARYDVIAPAPKTTLNEALIGLKVTFIHIIDRYKMFTWRISVIRPYIRDLSLSLCSRVLHYMFYTIVNGNVS